MTDARQEGRDWAKQNPKASIFEQGSARARFAEEWGYDKAAQFFACIMEG